MNKLLYSVLSEKKLSSQIPIWFMRQAGRYLPEYRQKSKEAGSFVTLCQTPSLTSDVTLQPMVRFNFDAAIIFSDILIVPYALGMSLEFISQKGPQLNPSLYEKPAFVYADNETIQKKLSPVYEAIKDVRFKLDPSKTLIGFVGAPWTLASYMIEGKTSKQFHQTIEYAYQHSKKFEELLEKLIQTTAQHAISQIKAGCDVIQIFDSWAGSVPKTERHYWIDLPIREVVRQIREACPMAKIIVFPKGVHHHLLDFINFVKPDGIGIDYTISPDWVKQNIPKDCVVQGNLDPRILAYAPLLKVLSDVDHILEMWCERPFIFNLGHGIIPDTPIAHVEAVINHIRKVTL